MPPYLPFQPRTPFLLPSPHSQGQDQIQQLPPLNAQDIVGKTWHMIASSSSMWLDRKHSIKINYSAAADSDGEGGSKLTETTAWCSENSSQPSSTKGVSSPLANGSGQIYDWRGAGWLRLITTRWEIVGLGELPYHSSAGTGTVESGSDVVAVVMVTFVQKTMFSPAALSVLVLQDEQQQEQVYHDTQRWDILKAVLDALKGLGSESLDGEIDKVKIIAGNRS